MDKKERKLIDFLKDFKEEFLSVVDFLNKKTFHRGELTIVFKNICSNIKASEEEQNEIVEILDIGEPVKVAEEEATGAELGGSSKRYNSGHGGNNSNGTSGNIAA